MNPSFISKDLVFPLSLNYVSWNFSTLTLSGEEWFLNSEKSWSVYKGEELIFDDCIENDKIIYKTLNGLSLLHIEDFFNDLQQIIKIYFEYDISISFSGEGEFYVGKK